MHIVIVTVGSTGDVIPMIALGRELQKNGVRITLATHEIFRNIVLQNGLQFASLAGDPMAIIKSKLGQELFASSNSSLQMLFNFKKIQQSLLKDILHDAWQVCQGANAIIYSSLLQVVAPSIMEALQIPGIAVLLQPLHPTKLFPCPLLTKSLDLGKYLNFMTWSLLEISQWFPFKTIINKWRREELHLPNISSSWRYLSQTRKNEKLVIYAISPSFLKKPYDWGQNIKLPGFFYLDDNSSWQRPEKLVEFLSNGDKPIYLGFGSAVSVKHELIYEHFINFITKNKLRGIIGTGWADCILKPSSDSIFMLKEAPHQWLFPHVKAAIHHGGTGTMAATLRAGIPSLVIPFAFDEPLWGFTAARAGIGPSPLLLSEYHEDSFNKKLADLIHNTSYENKSRELSHLIHEERGVEMAAKSILEIL